MSITSVKGIVLTGLIALALVACGGEEGPGGDGSTYGVGGAGGIVERPPNVPAEAYKWPAAWVFKCEDIKEDVLIKGALDINNRDVFNPPEATLKVGQILAFLPHTTTQNFESGVYPERDGKFSTVQSYRRCLVFDEPGTYPFHMFASLHPNGGNLYIVE